ncbi:MAG: helix-turn-helix domain-containing protein [Lachnospiraceae bacterium]
MSDEVRSIIEFALPALGASRRKNPVSLDVYGRPSKVEQIDRDIEQVQLKNESGTGEITVYRVFSGVDVIYNDMHLEYCNKNQQVFENVIEINHCRQGRYECSYDNFKYCYMEPGDMSIASQLFKKKDHCFPGSHYHGVTILIKPDEIESVMQQVFDLLLIDLGALCRKAASSQTCFIMRANEKIEHIFSELYTVREEIKAGYLKIKILEIMLVLGDLEFDHGEALRLCLTKKQADAVKGIHDFMLANISEHYTLAQLSERFDLSISQMKRSFPAVYGDSVYAYLRKYRLQLAERLLLEEDLNISQVAERIGYGNPAKFSSAFKQEIGISPKTYQKRLRTDRIEKSPTGVECSESLNYNK